MCPTKFIFVKIKSRENLGEFLRFLENVWTPLKFIEDSNIEYVPRFLTLFILGIWSLHNWEHCEKYSNLASCKIWNFLEHGKASILNLQFSAEDWILEKNLNLAGLTCQRPISYLPPWPGNRTRATHQGASHRVVATLTVLSATDLATADCRRRRSTCLGRPYHSCVDEPWRSLLHFILSHSLSLSLSALLLHSHSSLGSPLSTTTVHLHHRPSQWTTPPSSIEGVATPSSSSRRPHHRVELHPDRFFHREPTVIDDHASTSSGPTNHTASFLVILCCFPTLGSTPAATGLSRRRQLPRLQLPCQPPPIDSLWDNLPPQLLLLRHLVVGRPESTDEAPARRGEIFPLLRS
jgi:hypothetical protein